MVRRLTGRWYHVERGPPVEEKTSWPKWLSTGCCRSRRSGTQTADSAVSSTTSCTGWTFLGGAVQAVCNGPSTSAAQSTTVHDGLLHPHLRHCSSPASAVRRLPSAVCTATPAFLVRPSRLFCSRPGGLELVTRLPARSVTYR